MHNAAMAALGLDLRYLAFEVNPAHLREAIAGCRAMGFVGLNLTVPHKLLAVEMVDALDDTARQWGAVNTIRFEGWNGEGGWRPLLQLDREDRTEIRTVGFNTDADAIVRSIEEDLSLRIQGLRVLVLGAGGAGRVAALRLASGGAAGLHLVNRTPSRAEEVAGEIRRRFPDTHVEVGMPANPIDLVLNATSVGLKPGDSLPFDPGTFSFQRTRAAYDMVYRPAMTPFLAAAQAAGCRVANGLGMLLHQGAKALEIWTGTPAPVDVMKQALQRHLGT
jgi:shikimate dehydrogenase